ncbi:MAG TPA: TMEM175 family protein [Sphingomonas sp.]|jgi:uncharacterized membrane protein|nr:TMEM175 family protein [Sphingomonas sp.]
MESAHHRSQLERLTFFSDAVFAIAMTLLVIEVKVPEIHALSDRQLGQALLAQFPKYVGFVISFIVVARFWVGHHRVMGLLKATSPRLIWANLIFLLVIAFMPFPTAVLSEYVELRVAVGLYAGWLMLLGLANRWVIRTALKDPALMRDDADPGERRAILRASWISPGIGALAFAVGMIEPLAAPVALVLGSVVIGAGLRRIMPD